MIHSSLLMEAIMARKSGRAALVLTQAQTAMLKELSGSRTAPQGSRTFRADFGVFNSYGAVQDLERS